METVQKRKLTEELKTHCMFYFDEDLEFCCSERKKSIWTISVSL